MSVLIKGIKMPQCCEECFFDDYLHNGCQGTGNYIVRKKWEEKPSWCPIVEVPQHGDLIDRDKASERFAKLSEMIDAKLGYECSASYTLASMFLQNKAEFPTIIEADMENG